MKQVIVVDDERIILKAETAVVQKVLPQAEVTAFRSPEEALTFGESRTIDIAFLDIDMMGISGLTLAKRLQQHSPHINIIFCTGYSEYALEAYELYATAYLLKPITEEAVRKALSHLRYAAPETRNRVSVQCFGSFQVLCDGKPVRFKYNRTLELFAILVDRKGALVRTGEIMSILFADEEKASYTRNLRADLISTFQQLGVEEVLTFQRGQLGVRRDMLDCDYYEYLSGRRELFRGEYMSQYSFGEETLALLTEKEE